MLRQIEEETTWLEVKHIDNYLCCIRRIRDTQSPPGSIYDENYVVVSSSLFGYMQYVWDTELEKGKKHFVLDEVKLPKEWSRYVLRENDKDFPWWAVDHVSLLHIISFLFIL